MTLTLFRGACLLALSALVACQNAEPALPAEPSTLFASPWNSGQDKAEPDFHVQAIDEDTFVLRQSLRDTFEAPFLYLMFGDERALLIDTGVEGGDLRTEVDRLTAAWLQARGREDIALTVMHSHGHGDHIGGDSGFEGRAKTEIVGHTPEDVASFFGFNDAADEAVPYDLGGRRLQVLATPGHHPSHVMVFDPATHILFTGDTVYPGRLYFQCGKLAEFRETIDRVSEFSEANEVSWLLGGHIEMTTTPGKTFSPQDRARDGEHLLEMPASTLRDVQAALAGMAERPVVSEFDNFILFPHPADPRGKRPPNWCLAKEE